MWIHDFVNFINSGNSRWLKCWSLGVLDNWLIIDIGNVYSKAGFKMNNIDIPTIILKHSENKKWLWDETVTQTSSQLQRWDTACRIAPSIILYLF